MKAALDAQRAAGIFTEVSAGNSGAGGCGTVQDPPAFFGNVFSVGALNNGADSLANFSSRGPVTVDGSNRLKPDITAPGTNVVSSIPGGYASLNGTSMAGPHVAGAVALLWSAYPRLRGNIDVTEQILRESAVPITQTNPCGTSNVPNNLYGYGRLDVQAAVSLTAQLGYISLTVMGGGGLLVPNALITVTGVPTPTTFTTQADASGQAYFPVLARSYALTLSAPNYLSTTQNFTVTAGVTTSQALTLPAWSQMAVSVTASSVSVELSQSLTATVGYAYTASPGCQFAVYSVSLVTSPTLTLTSASTLGPPVSGTPTFTLTTVTTGTSTLTANVYGEEQCNTWTWKSYYGTSGAIAITVEKPYRFYFPLIGR
jgi:subtilisin family serine protease